MSEEKIVVSARPAQPKPGNRKLVIFFKVVIVSVLTVPWIVAGAVALSFYFSSLNYSQEIASYQQSAQLLQSEKETVQSELDDANRQLVEVVEEKETLQRSVLELENSSDATNGASSEAGSIHGVTTTHDQEDAVEKDGKIPLGEQLEELALQVIRGNWGNGLTRVRKLQNEGYSHSIIQQRVNEIIWGD